MPSLSRKQEMEVAVMRRCWSIGIAVWCGLLGRNAHAEGLITRTYDTAVANYTYCAERFEIADAISEAYPFRAKEAAEVAANCREKEVERTKDAIIPLKAAANENLNTLDAVRGFYAFWQSALKQMSSSYKHPNIFKDEFRRRLEQLRAELNLEW
jgi:hypothetical protein